TFGEIEVHDECVHQTGDGRRFLVLHGDRFDMVIRYSKWLAMLGDSAYTFILWLNTYFNAVRRRLGYPYWSLSSYLKLKTKRAVEFIASFEAAVADEARGRGLDGVICGHIHHAEMKNIGDITYCNDGDWVESCTALVEHADGRLEILNWAEVRELSFV
ncbi:MAG: UDP-2,3-diacylglucosamine diphosphatase, partial [Alphaproteobacteria bacterium]|nr:UDP-2,3-diacylglucosamine diphosphatase [Alphaproteobacteria bacterium]